MKVPSNAQARALSRISELDRAGSAVLWKPDTQGRRASIFYEAEDRERNRAGLRYLFRANCEQPLEATILACLKAGWLDGTHERVFASGLPIIGVYFTREREAEVARQLDLTEDGRIALGVWRERKMQAPPVEQKLSEREQEIVELADRAYQLGYALCAREPARKEARRMRKEGWWDGCWVANSATGLVPSSLATVEVFPERADQPARPLDRPPSPFDRATS